MPPSPPPARHRRHAVIALACGVVLLIPAAQLYRTHHAASAGLPTSSPPLLEGAPAAETSAASAFAGDPVEARPESAARAGVDASNFYKNAFVLCAALTDEEKKMFHQPLKEADADQAAALFKKIQPILELLRLAADADYCEWGLGPLDFESQLPHLPKAQELGRLAQWSASYRFPSDPQGALADLAAQARLGDHLAESVIGWLVQTSMEAGAIKVVRQNTGVLGAAEAAQAQEFFQASSVEENVARAFAAESRGVAAMGKKFAALSPEARMKLFRMNAGMSEEDRDPTLEKKFADSAFVTAEFQNLEQLERQMTAAMFWPEAQFQAWWKNVESGLPEHPLAQVSLPVFVGLRTRLQRSQVERTMLSAGLTLLQSGPEQLAQFRDPVSGAVFAYVAKPDGFELRSTFKAGGKPVTMSFTQPK